MLLCNISDEKVERMPRWMSNLCALNCGHVEVLADVGVVMQTLVGIAEHEMKHDLSNLSLVNSILT